MHPSSTEPELASHVVGIDLGGTKIRAGIAARDGEIIATRTAPTPTERGAILETIATMLDHLAAAAGIDLADIVGVGVGVAGAVRRDGTVAQAPNLTAIDRAPFASELAVDLGLPVLIDNDVNIAALGELQSAADRDLSDFVYIAVGTGIGMGIVADGRIIRGTEGAAGEIGFLPLGADPFDQANHRRGALEELVAGDRLAERFSDAAGEHADGARIFELAAAGDPAATAAIEVESHWIAVAIAAVAAVLDPAEVILGGGIGSQPAIAAAVRDTLPALGITDLPVSTSTIAETAPILGAIRLALDGIDPSTRGSRT
jgi:predicted NBD/HSP70 family sugar kinase